jgi:hypothetical protein
MLHMRWICAGPQVWLILTTVRPRRQDHADTRIVVGQSQLSAQRATDPQRCRVADVATGIAYRDVPWMATRLGDEGAGEGPGITVAAVLGRLVAQTHHPVARRGCTGCGRKERADIQLHPTPRARQAAAIGQAQCAAPETMQESRDDRDARAGGDALQTSTEHVHLSAAGDLPFREDDHHFPGLGRRNRGID